ncbi:unannotated protein [freshwater metagenome]|uniref:Unannotated protein n=1 Tax=freshwater metagenome TaxID=449393 RepID=A0A6J7JKG0_9ZZZZ|nr:hypothetical protein [Actinomycetota bacterium]
MDGRRRIGARLAHGLRLSGAVVGISALAVVLSGARAHSASVQAPPANAGFDLQLGGAYAPPAGVGVVERDRTAPAPPTGYGVCYVNGFQTQDAEIAWWRRAHPELLLRVRGREVRDPDWPETLLDITTPARRRAVVRIVGRWIDGCARRGYRAVELDNLDSWTRSKGRITVGDTRATARLLTGRAHGAGLAAGQKNAAELIRGARRPLGFDFAVVEQCQEYDECDRYTRAYGDRVMEVEYDPAAFRAACAARGARISIVLRDLDLVPAGRPGHVFRGC